MKKDAIHKQIMKTKAVVVDKRKFLMKRDSSATHAVLIRFK